jgi:hypothetical protein
MRGERERHLKTGKNGRSCSQLAAQGQDGRNSNSFKELRLIRKTLAEPVALA